MCGRSPSAGRAGGARGLTLSAVEVSHALDRRFRTDAGRVDDARRAFVYPSDVGRLEPSLERFARGARLLAVDAAIWRRRLFAHLTIDRALPGALPVAGRADPAHADRAPHEQLEQAVRAICSKASPAWDGLMVDLR